MTTNARTGSCSPGDADQSTWPQGHLPSQVSASDIGWGPPAGAPEPKPSKSDRDSNGMTVALPHLEHLMDTLERSRIVKDVNCSTVTARVYHAGWPGLYFTTILPRLPLGVEAGSAPNQPDKAISGSEVRVTVATFKSTRTDPCST